MGPGVARCARHDGGAARSADGNSAADRRSDREVGGVRNDPAQYASRAAEALDCTLVYALVPNTSLEAAVTERARKIAMRELKRVAHTMRLEAQGTDDGDIEARVQAYIRDQLSERDLWSER